MLGEKDGIIRNIRVREGRSANLYSWPKGLFFDLQCLAIHISNKFNITDENQNRFYIDTDLNELVLKVNAATYCHIKKLDNGILFEFHNSGTQMYEEILICCNTIRQAKEFINGLKHVCGEV